MLTLTNGKIPHAAANCWPLLVLAGSSETHNSGKGAFQEMDAISMLTPHAKLALRPPGPEFIPGFIRDAYRTAMFGRPGPTFVDLPANLILGHFDVERTKLVPYVEAPKSVAPERNVAEAVRLLKSAKAPLVVLGKGAAYGRAEGPIRQLIERYNPSAKYQFYERVADLDPGLACPSYRHQWVRA
jgi:2-hydroxyacyl-CoA lyase 1